MTPSLLLKVTCTHVCSLYCAVPHELTWQGNIDLLTSWIMHYGHTLYSTCLTLWLFVLRGFSSTIFQPKLFQTEMLYFEASLVTIWFDCDAPINHSTDNDSQCILLCEIISHSYSFFINWYMWCFQKSDYSSLQDRKLHLFNISFHIYHDNENENAKMIYTPILPASIWLISIC